MEHHILFRVVGMEMAHMGQGNDMVLGLGNDMVLGLEDGKQVLGDMEQGMDDMEQHDVEQHDVEQHDVEKHDVEKHDVDGVLVDGMAQAHDILDEVVGILAFCEEDLAWRTRGHCGIQQHQSDRMFLCIH